MSLWMDHNLLLDDLTVAAVVCGVGLRVASKGMRVRQLPFTLEKVRMCG